ncbi:MAG: BrnT family toxin [Proteobacteria bacterium]|nr:BrnT family toxin [Pseudomonadota bacterium]MBI3498734.1 BrnT family toxin [Pseudomonadota bacterium]
MPSDPWNATKRRINRERHGIDFAVLDEEFVGPFVRRRSDRRGEERWLQFGLLGSTVIAVVYTMRNGRRRWISARPARKDERKRYDEAIATQARDGPD